MIKPHTPSPRANELVCAGVKEIGYAVAFLVKQRPVVIAQEIVRKHEFGFAPFADGVVGHQSMLVI
jgi:hypothetical protein